MRLHDPLGVRPRVFVTCAVFARWFSVAFSGLFHGPRLPKTVFVAFSFFFLFRDFFAAFGRTHPGKVF